MLLTISTSYSQVEDNSSIEKLEGNVIQLDFVNQGTIIKASKEIQGDGRLYLLYVNTLNPVVPAYKPLYNDSILAFVNVKLGSPENDPLTMKQLDIRYNEIEGDAKRISLAGIPSSPAGIARMNVDAVPAGQLLYEAGTLKNQAVVLSIVSVGLVVGAAVIPSFQSSEVLQYGMYAGASISSIMAIVKVVKGNKKLQEAGTSLIREEFE